MFDIVFVSVCEISVRGTAPVGDQLTFTSLANAAPAQAEPPLAVAEWVAEALLDSVREAA